MNGVLTCLEKCQSVLFTRNLTTGACECTGRGKELLGGSCGCSSHFEVDVSECKCKENSTLQETTTGGVITYTCQCNQNYEYKTGLTTCKPICSGNSIDEKAADGSFTGNCIDCTLTNKIREGNLCVCNPANSTTNSDGTCTPCLQPRAVDVANNKCLCDPLTETTQTNGSCVACAFPNIILNNQCLEPCETGFTRCSSNPNKCYKFTQCECNTDGKNNKCPSPNEDDTKCFATDPCTECPVIDNKNKKCEVGSNLLLCYATNMCTECATSGSTTQCEGESVCFNATLTNKCNVCNNGVKPNVCSNDQSKCYSTNFCLECHGKSHTCPAGMHITEACYESNLCSECTNNTANNACPTGTQFTQPCYGTNMCNSCTANQKPKTCPLDSQECYSGEACSSCSSTPNYCNGVTPECQSGSRCPCPSGQTQCPEGLGLNCYDSTLEASNPTKTMCNLCSSGSKLSCPSDASHCYDATKTNYCTACPIPIAVSTLFLCTDDNLCYENGCPSTPSPTTCGSGQFSCKGVCKDIGKALYCPIIDLCIEGLQLFSKATGNIDGETPVANLNCPCSGFNPSGSNPDNNQYFDNPLVIYISGTCRTAPPNQETAGVGEIICPDDNNPGTYVTRLKENTIYCPDTGKCYYINDAIYCPDLVGGPRCVYSAEYLSETWQNLTFNQIICPCKDPKYMWIDFYGDMKCVEFAYDSNGIPKALCDNTLDPKEIKCSTNGNCVAINYFTELCPGVIDCGAAIYNGIYAPSIVEIVSQCLCCENCITCTKNDPTVRDPHLRYTRVCRVKVDETCPAVDQVDSRITYVDCNKIPNLAMPACNPIFWT